MKVHHQFFLALWLSLAAFPFSAQASQYDIKEMTPQVKQAIAGRQSRYAQLQELKASGAAGENNQGYVEVLNASGNAASIVQQENRDRRTIYETIVAQNQLGPQGLTLVEKAFAEVQREKSKSR